MSDEEALASLCATGIDRLEAGAPGDALRLFEQARALGPRNARVHYLVAIALADQRDLDGALGALQTSIALDASSAKAHNNLGSILQQQGRLAEAAPAYRRAIELDPDLPQPRLNLAKLLEQTGAHQDAVAVYDEAIARGLDRDVFVQNKAALLRQNSPRSPDAWVKSTFDNFAPTFEQHLRDLRYDIPRDLADLVRARLAPRARVVDLGCGTGLIGASLADARIHLVGVDLSPRMLTVARAKSCYAELHEREVHAFLQEVQAGSLDGAFAGDVLIYIGDLVELFAELARTLRHGAFLAFSTEECVGNDYRLLPTGRYAQSFDYIARLADRDFMIERHEPRTIRFESGTPVPGRVYVLVRT